jgi:hypothetical protein
MTGSAEPQSPFHAFIQIPDRQRRAHGTKLALLAMQSTLNWTLRIGCETLIEPNESELVRDRPTRVLPKLAADRTKADGLSRG